MKWMGLIFFGIVFLACHKKSGDKEILPINKMKGVMWDMIRADEWFTQTQFKDSLRKRTKENFELYEQVFKIHHTNKAQYYNSYKYYEAHPVVFKELIDSVNALAEREKWPGKPVPIPANPK